MIETFLVLASVYWEDKWTSTGAKFNPLGLTVAHRTLPFGTCLKLKRGIKYTTATVNDRGPCTTKYCQKHTPYILKVILDLSLGTAKKLNMGKNSKNKIRYWIVDKNECINH